MAKIFSKTGDNAKGGKRIGEKLVEGYELRSPAGQNAVDLIPGWTSMFPPESKVEAGNMYLFGDGRIFWAMECFGDVRGKRVLELGPLEGAHTTILEKAGATVDAVESGGLAYLKCLITKEVVGLKNAHFFLGDCNGWLEENATRYDFVVACGILYHMVDPIRLLRAMAERSNDIYIWTMFIDDDTIPVTRVQRFAGVDVRLYRIMYGERAKTFCGGANPDAMWIHRSDLIAVLEALGFQLKISTTDVTPHGHAGSFFASRRPFAEKS